MTSYLKAICTILLLSTIGCTTQKSVQQHTQTTTSTTPKNIILLIGDGMGLSQVSASYFYKDGTPNFDRFTTIGLIKTSAADAVITDSAASASAYATGVSTYNGAISVNTKKEAVPTLTEQIAPYNISAGIVATSSVVHATPASFYAHAESRKMYDKIATFLPTANVAFIAGGGKQFFNNRKDNKNLFKELEKNGYEVHTTSLPTTVSEKKQAIILADDGMPKIEEGRGNFLPEATKMALEKLSKNKNGFFLLVEGSQIDWGGHANDADYLISELLDFDKTIGVALDFAKQNGETLVLVTADHETGGFTLAAKKKNYNKIKPTFSTKGHSATMVPIFAKGPKENDFSGVFKNTALFSKMLHIFTQNQSKP